MLTRHYHLAWSLDNQKLLDSLSWAFKDRKDVAFAECHSVEEALRAVAENQPEVLFLDHELTKRGNEGLEIARQLKGVKIYSTTGMADETLNKLHF